MYRIVAQFHLEMRMTMDLCAILIFLQVTVPMFQMFQFLRYLHHYIHYLQTSQFPSCHSPPDYKTVWELTAYEENEAVQEFYVPVLSNFILTPEALSKNTKAKNLASEARKKTRQPQLTQIMPTIDVDSIPANESKDKMWVDKLTESDENRLVSGRWLNDSIINAAQSLISERFP